MLYHKIHTVYLSLGSNLGDSLFTVKLSIIYIQNIQGILTCKSSPFYKTEPINSTGSYYINTVLMIKTTLSPHILLKKLQFIENLLGRVRNFKNEPRTIDIDILLYDNLKIKTKKLIIPHPLMHLRLFVLKPLFDINPLIKLPMGNIHIFLNKTKNQLIEKI
ncbi:2-amino-4-hydroxy-6- hydroxymethyldihydropteridine pyrophosphokinase [Candidatus Kinetoplastibacterium sorsogonicusi]|uniref:2-amino-4-hydroxy-6-hydroxymethyldihydropteridine pyrophosphokinase n=1 Tax=Candidatus Kinetoplastidibacterium kentomonadis TaxID=1576550 RepID=A0A3Q8ETX5_9PROT|nr:2-amino-4-hydroxy-6-hydroxymethyldihydropteridine diphosphokinase [Candidatus Kinetoplastibacterium sorsogonicusi]AWD32649.1 2-amino-4-hydroxy-6- hydroxymethyldihydropteridine pyrophosphokinase [Candidatus Kinetoplastibacterium sorsogonicusi]